MLVFPMLLSLMVCAEWSLGYHNVCIKSSYLPRKLGKYNFFRFPETHSQNPTRYDNVLARLTFPRENTLQVQMSEIA